MYIYIFSINKNLIYLFKSIIINSLKIAEELLYYTMYFDLLFIYLNQKLFYLRASSH